MNTRKVFFGIGILLCFGFYLLPEASAELILPNPVNLYDGIPIASQHDDFWSYSVPVMTTLGSKQNLNLPELQGFNFSTGEGGLDLLLYTGAGGAGQSRYRAGR